MSMLRRRGTRLPAYTPANRTGHRLRSLRRLSSPIRLRETFPYINRKQNKAGANILFPY